MLFNIHRKSLFICICALITILLLMNFGIYVGTCDISDGVSGKQRTHNRARVSGEQRVDFGKHKNKQSTGEEAVHMSHVKQKKLSGKYFMHTDISKESPMDKWENERNRQSNARLANTKMDTEQVVKRPLVEMSDVKQKKLSGKYFMHTDIDKESPTDKWENGRNRQSNARLANTKMDTEQVVKRPLVEMSDVKQKKLSGKYFMHTDIDKESPMDKWENGRNRQSNSRLANTKLDTVQTAKRPLVEMSDVKQKKLTGKYFMHTDIDKESPMDKWENGRNRQSNSRLANTKLDTEQTAKRPLVEMSDVKQKKLSGKYFMHTDIDKESPMDKWENGRNRQSNSRLANTKLDTEQTAKGPLVEMSDVKQKKPTYISKESSTDKWDSGRTSQSNARLTNITMVKEQTVKRPLAEISGDKPKFQENHPVPISGKWTIFYNETMLHETIKDIHDSYYERSFGDRCVQRYPGVIVVGVSKSGTRELSDFMAMHPNMVVKSSSSRYKISYGRFYKQDKEAICNLMPCTYTNQFGSIKQDFFFEKVEIPMMLHKFDPNQKIIAIVREPISRMISQQSFREIKKGHDIEYVTFNIHVLPSSGDRLNNDSNIVKLSSYANCLERYLKYFTLDQILILETEELNKHPAYVLSRIEEFLGLQQTIDFEKHFVRNPETGFYCVRMPYVNNKMACYNSNRGRGKVETVISERQMSLLKDYFMPLNEKFFQQIGRRFEHWMY